MSESRRFTRIHFDAEVQLNIHLIDDIHIAHLIDISLKGALVETDRPITTYIKERSCIMTLALDNHEQKITMQGKIIHHEGSLIGLESLHIDLDSITNLRKLIQLNTSDDKHLDTELSHMLKNYENLNVSRNNN
ncbi:PilZ domain-containing protein [Methylotenera sp.]|uniref:PilZ domain-containing protein n=1 Tax=Methylotenera sp. TaxID=2051956 RepID=UPI0027370D9D|nr:PilZ domain-containing protein [Methylotenera sp.]MDP3775939.1 PilZ domain-containing protein [Methylotenera sp.]